MNPKRHIWELTFPAGLDHTSAARLFVAMSGLFRPIGDLALPGVPTLTFEWLSTAEGLRTFITLPAAEAAPVHNRLLGVMPSLDVRQLDEPPEPRQWNEVGQLHRPEEGLVDVDPRLTQQLLQSLVITQPDQAVTVQFVLTPTGRPAAGAAEPVFFAVPRIAASAGTRAAARELLHRVRSAYRSVHMFDVPRIITRKEASQEVNERTVRLLEMRSLMSPATLAAACMVPLGTPHILGLRLGAARQLVPDAAIRSDGRQVLVTKAFGETRVLALSPKDRTRHFLAVGPSGLGKTTLLENLILGDIEDGFGLAYIDPKGDSVDRILDRIPEKRLDDVVLYDPADEDWSTGFNVLEGPNPYAVAGQIIQVLKSTDPTFGGAARAVNLLRAALATLALGGYTLCEVPLILSAGSESEAFRAKLVPLTDANPPMRQVWKAFEAARDKEDRADPILHRLSAILYDPRLYHSLGQRASGFNLADVLSSNKILLVPLNEHDLGDEVRPLIGSLVTAKLWQAAQGRRSGRHRPFFFYVDEFTSMAAGSFVPMVERARGHDTGLVLAHQQPGQIRPEAVQRDVYANIASKVVFQQANEDSQARILARELGEPVTSDDVKNLGRYEVLARLAVEGATSRAVSGRTQALSDPVLFEYQEAGRTEIKAIGDEARRRSRASFSRPMSEVRAELDALHGRTAAGTRRLPRVD